MAGHGAHGKRNPEGSSWDNTLRSAILEYIPTLVPRHWWTSAWANWHSELQYWASQHHYAAIILGGHTAIRRQPGHPISAFRPQMFPSSHCL